MKKPIFTGAGVAIVTPFEGEDLKINFPLFEEIIENQIQNGTDAIVVPQTTIASVPFKIWFSIISSKSGTLIFKSSPSKGVTMATPAPVKIGFFTAKTSRK